MKISKMQELLDAKVLCCEENLSKHVYSAFGCDLMSDVLAYVTDQAVLLTGLVNPQVIRTALMMDMVCIVFVRNKEPSEAMLELARDFGLVVMRSSLRAFEACGRLYEGGLGGKLGDAHV
jgi:hypothetical protein